jgi:chloride channel 7
MATEEYGLGEPESPISTPLATPITTPMSTRSVKWGEAAGALERPLLRQRGKNTTSQIAVVGANTCPIESLDYEYVPLLCFSVVFTASSVKSFVGCVWEGFKS